MQGKGFNGANKSFLGLGGFPLPLSHLNLDNAQISGVHSVREECDVVQLINTHIYIHCRGSSLPLACTQHTSTIRQILPVLQIQRPASLMKEFWLPRRAIHQWLRVVSEENAQFQEFDVCPGVLKTSLMHQEEWSSNPRP